MSLKHSRSSKMHKKDHKARFEMDTKLKEFLIEFKLKVNARNGTRARVLEEYCKSISNNSVNVLRKIPKCYQDIPAIEYFDGVVKENVEKEFLTNLVQSVGKIQETPIAFANHLKNILPDNSTCDRVLRSRNVKESSKSVKASVRRLSRHIKTKEKSSNKKILTNGKRTAQKRKVENTEEPKGGLGGDFNFDSVQNTSDMKEFQESESYRCTLTSDSGKVAQFNINNVPTLLIPNKMIILTHETSSENIILDAPMVNDLKLLQKNILTILKANRQ